MRQYAWVTAILLALCVVPLAWAQSAKEIEAKLKRFDAVKREEQQVTRAVKEAEQSLKTIRRDAAKLARDVQKSEEALIATERELRAASIERDAALKSLKQHAATYRASIISVLHMRQLPASMVLAPQERQEALRQTASAMALLEASLRTQLKALQKSHVRFDRAQKNAKEARDKMAGKQRKLAKEYGALEVVLKERERHYAILKQRQKNLNQEVQALAKTAKNLQDLLHKLDAKKRAELSQHLNLRPITRAKGALVKPVAGKLDKYFGARKNANETYRGVEIDSRARATVLAPFDGEVAFSGNFREYGQMLLIRHTSGYMSLLAGLGSNNVLVGTKVRAGEPVGKMGADPAKLYIELRKDSKPIDPAAWYAKL